VLTTIDLLPGARNTQAEWKDLVARAVPSTAVVVAKRNEHHVTYDGTYYFWFVTLEHEQGGSKSRAELAFRRTAAAWDQLGVGTVVPIQVDPDQPGRFYAPSFLEIDERFAPEAVEYWMYLGLGGAVLVAMGLLFYTGVLGGRLGKPIADRAVANRPGKDG
jgi:hypothetical protein